MTNRAFAGLFRKFHGPWLWHERCYTSSVQAALKPATNRNSPRIQTMKLIRSLALIAVLTGALGVSHPGSASAADTGATSGNTQVEPPATDRLVKGEKPENPEKPGAGRKPEDAGNLVSDEVKALRVQFKQEQKDLLEKYKELLKAARDVSQEELEKVREQFKAAREELQAKQKELRDEFKAKLDEFKKEHPEQDGLVDAAKEARDKARRRRGNG